MDADIGVGLNGETRPCCCQRHSAIISGIHTPTTQLVEAAEERGWTRILLLGWVGKPGLAVVSVIPRSSAAYTPRLRNWLKPQKNADGRGFWCWVDGETEALLLSASFRDHQRHTHPDYAIG